MSTAECAHAIKPLRAAIMWPFPRLDRIRKRERDANQHEEMDGLSYLIDRHIEPLVVDSSPRVLNPLAKHGSLWAGIDPVRFIRLLLGYRRFDVLISIDSSSCLLFVLLKRLLGLRKPVMVIDPALDRAYRNRARVNDLVLPHVEEVIVFGEVQREFCDREYGGRVPARFLPHRMDVDFFDPAKAEPSASETWGVLSVGDDIGRDFGCLLEAVKGMSTPVLIRTRMPLPKPLPDNVSVHSDWISFAGLRSLYAASSVVVVPVHHTLNASGINALLESMSMGRAVVVSASPGLKDYLRHGENAWVVEPEDPLALRAAIEKLLADPTLRRRLGAGARLYCERHTAMPHYAANIAQSIRRLTAR